MLTVRLESAVGPSPDGDAGIETTVDLDDPQVFAESDKQPTTSSSDDDDNARPLRHTTTSPFLPEDAVHEPAPESGPVRCGRHDAAFVYAAVSMEAFFRIPTSRAS